MTDCVPRSIIKISEPLLFIYSMFLINECYKNVSTNSSNRVKRIVSDNNNTTNNNNMNVNNTNDSNNKPSMNTQNVKLSTGAHTHPPTHVLKQE